MEKEKVSPTTEPKALETVAVQVVPTPTTTGLATHATAVVVVALLTVREVVPVLPALLLSPLKVAVMVTGEVPLAGVYVTAQLVPELIVHVVELN